MKEVFFICSDKLDRETIELPKEITTYYIQYLNMVEDIVGRAEKEYEIVRLKKLVLRELTRLERMTGKDLSKAKKTVIEQAKLTLEVLRRQGVIDEHLYGYLIQKIEIDRNAFIAKMVIKYLKNVQEELRNMIGIDKDKIKHLMDEYNAILDTLKKRFKLIEIPCQEAVYMIDELFYSLFGKDVVDWERTRRALEVRVRCLIDFLESIIEAVEEEEERILLAPKDVREATTP